MNMNRLILILLVFHTIFVILQIPIIRILNTKVVECLLFYDTLIYLFELFYYGALKEKGYD